MNRALPFRRVAFVMHSGWRFLFQRPHHFAERFRAAGIETVVFEVSGVRSQVKNLITRAVSAEQTDTVDHLWSTWYLYKLSERFPPVERLLLPVIAGSYHRFARRYLDKDTLLWLQGVNMVIPPEILFEAPRRLSVVDICDDFAGFYLDDPRMHAKLLRYEDATARGTDVVLVSAARLEERLRSTNPHTLLARNGVSARFIEAGERARRQPAQHSRPVVAYQGAFASWFDWELLERVLELLPDFEFRLMGRVFPDVTDRMARLVARPNVRHLGILAHRDLPEQLAAVDAGIIPFRINDLTLATDPIKLYEYLGCGLPVVSTPLPEVLMRESPGMIRTAADAEGFAAALRELVAVRRDDELAGRRIALARENTWDSRFEDVLAALRARSA